ncbi:hypothetical protein ACFVTX_02510 [Agromyces sp. NPDC058136]|uniref:hypothetical protein n=1 Tax=Agromyces sp. NPDC058136 TaxID=3346354 RepID=UPI0036DA5FAA
MDWLLQEQHARSRFVRRMPHENSPSVMSLRVSRVDALSPWAASRVIARSTFQSGLVIAVLVT